MPTKAIARTNALKLSAWLAVHEPKLFRQLYSSSIKVMASPLGRLGYFGDDGDLSEITITAGQDTSTPDFSSVDTSNFNPDVSLTDISFDPGTIPPISQDTADTINQAIASPSSTDSSSGGFWSSIASGASAVAGAVSKVANALVSPQSINAAGNVAAAYFKTQASTSQLQMAQSQAQAQQAVVNAQLARVAQGYPPAPLTYQRNPLTGALTPVYQTNTGAVAATPSLLSRLSTPTSMGVSPTVLIGGGIAALLLITLAAARQ